MAAFSKLSLLSAGLIGGMAASGAATGMRGIMARNRKGKLEQTDQPLAPADLTEPSTVTAATAIPGEVTKRRKRLQPSAGPPTTLTPPSSMLGY